MGRLKTSDAATTRGPSRIVLLIVVLLVAGCTETRYVSMSESRGFYQVPFVRTIAYELDPSYRPDGTECVLILPTARTGPTDGLSGLVEAALARHLVGRFERVIGPKQRADAIDGLDQDLDESLADGLRFAALLDCDTVLASGLVARRVGAFGFWTELQIGLDLRLVRVEDQGVPWRARHVATRSNGGVPMSLPGLVMNALSAASLSKDHDAIESLVDDAVRRAMLSLPDYR